MSPPPDPSLLRALYPRLVRWFFSRTRNEQDAEDLAQETLLRMVKNPPPGPDPGTAYAWAIGIARHVLVDQFRRNLREQSAALPPGLAEQLAAALPEDRREEEWARLGELLHQLPPLYREVLKLHYFEHRSLGEICLEEVALERNRTGNWPIAALFYWREDGRCVLMRRYNGPGWPNYDELPAASEKAWEGIPHRLWHDEVLWNPTLPSPFPARSTG